MSQARHLFTQSPPTLSHALTFLYSSVESAFNPNCSPFHQNPTSSRQATSAVSPRSSGTPVLRNNPVQANQGLCGFSFHKSHLHLLIIHPQMLTHARILEMNITCCKILQAKLSTAEFHALLETRIVLCKQLLEAIEKVRSDESLIVRSL